jgi:chaperonin GroES
MTTIDKLIKMETETLSTDTINFQPLNKQVVFKQKEEETKSTGGIIFAVPNQDEVVYGEIVAVSNYEYHEVKVGDQVLVGRFGGAPLKLDGEDYLLMGEDNICGVLE